MAAYAKTTFLDTALELLSRAIEAEDRQNYPEAYAQYMAALDYLMAAEKAETNEKSKILLKEKADEYLGRAETIRQRVDGIPGERSGTTLSWNTTTNGGVLEKPTFTAQSAVLDEAFKCARQAIDADSSQNYVEAYKQYMKSMDYFMFAQRYEFNEQAKSLIRSEVAEYLTRAEMIKKSLISLEESRFNEVKPVNLHIGRPRTPQAIFLHTAVEISQLAVQQDIRQSYKAALELYNDALDYFMLAQKYEKNEQSKVAIRENIEKYLTRAEALKKLLRS